MKIKGRIIIIFLLVIAVTAGMIFYLNNDKDKEEVQIKKIETVNHDGVLTGSVIEFTNTTILVRDVNAHRYYIERNDKMTTGDKLILGDNITVKYTGDLKDNLDSVQNIQIHSIILEAIVTKNANNDPQKEEQTTSHTEDIAALLKAMTLEEKVAQMFFVRCPEKNAAEFVKEYQVGGYILFGRDFENHTSQQVKNNIKSYQNNSKIPMLIGTDEEGGTVNRVSRYLRKTEFKSPQELYKTGGFDFISKDTKEKSVFLQKFGINVNFAPVSDVSTNSHDFINSRAFGKNASQTAKYVRTVVEAMHQEKVGSVLKHFPGYGNNKDTHTDICIDKRSYSTFEKSDFIPFEEGIASGADSILVSHNIVNSMDKANPSSLSPKVHKILRETLKFNGVIMTDDLLMEGVRKLDTDANIAVKAVIAGNDMLLSSDAKEQIAAVIKAVKEGYISENQVNTSVLRILTWKKDLGLLKE